MRAETTLYRSVARRRRSVWALVAQIALATVLFAAFVALLGVVFAGSPAKLAEGTQIAGVDIGGLTERQAVAALQDKARSLAHTPVTFTAAGHDFEVAATQLGVEADWKGAVAAAARQGDGFGPFRGFRRLHTRFFGAEINPRVAVSNAALEYKLAELAAAVDRPHVEASVRRRGLGIEVVSERAGVRLRRELAARTIVRAVGSFERTGRIRLPVRIDAPKVTAAALAPAAEQARAALSAPVRLSYDGTTWKLPRWRIAELLSLPADGATKLAIAGPLAESYFEKLGKRVEQRPKDARFVVSGKNVTIAPGQDGLRLDVPATVRALTRAALSPIDRTAAVVVRVVPPDRTTAEAQAMGISGVVGTYTTTYGGTPGRLHNVRLVAQLIDDTLIPPGKTFSFNGTTGERNAAKGFEVAPVIINGELRNGTGGGVCQVSTTVFNAAFEAGLPIRRRTNHALYISHYPLGRDATVNYPDLDLRFTNDTGKWLLLRTFVGTGSLTVNLYGAPQDRRVETETAPLSVVGALPVRRIGDKRLPKGKTVVDETGVPPRSTRVRRRVFDASGKLLYDTTWRSYYVGEPTIVRVGTKKPAKPKAKQAKPGVTGSVDSAAAKPADTPAARPPGTTPTTATPSPLP